MRQRRDTTAPEVQPAPTSEPELGVSVATDKIPSTTEPIPATVSRDERLRRYAQKLRQQIRNLELKTTLQRPEGQDELRQKIDTLQKQLDQIQTATPLSTDATVGGSQADVLPSEKSDCLIAPNIKYSNSVLSSTVPDVHVNVNFIVSFLETLTLSLLKVNSNCVGCGSVVLSNSEETNSVFKLSVPTKFINAFELIFNTCKLLTLEYIREVPDRFKVTSESKYALTGNIVSGSGVSSGVSVSVGSSSGITISPSLKFTFSRILGSIYFFAITIFSFRSEEHTSELQSH